MTAVMDSLLIGVYMLRKDTEDNTNKQTGQMYHPHYKGNKPIWGQGDECASRMGTGPLRGVTSELRYRRTTRRWETTAGNCRAPGAEGLWLKDAVWQWRQETRTIVEQVAKSGKRVDPHNPRQGLLLKATKKSLLRRVKTCVLETG